MKKAVQDGKSGAEKHFADIDRQVQLFGYRFKTALDAMQVRDIAPMREALTLLDHSPYGALLVLRPDGGLAGVVADIDIRKFILKGGGLDTPVSEAMNSRPQVLRHGFQARDFLLASNNCRRRAIPFLDKNSVLAGIITSVESARDLRLDNPVVIMVGGRGMRLRPLTDSTPKPMLKVSGKPILEIIIGQLAKQGFHHFILAMNYKHEQIAEHFRDGRDFGVKIDYLLEERKLGTAGALSMLSREINLPIFVMNGDLLTKVDFRNILDFHSQERSLFTAGAVEYSISVPYGVLVHDGHRVKGVEEKPVFKYYINSGIYLLDPEVLDYLPQGEHCDMTDLINRLTADGKTVLTYPIFEYWLDIGRHPDLEAANTEYVKHFNPNPEELE